MAGEPRVMADGDFRDHKTLDPKQRRQEPVHALEKLQPRRALAPEHPVAAGGIADGFAGDAVADAVGDLRGKLFQTRIALRARRDARAAHAVAVLDGFQKLWQISRMILQIGVQRGDETAVCGLHAGPQRRRLAAVSVEPEGADFRVGRAERLQDFPGVVRAAIVRDDDLVSDVERLQRFADGGHERNQIVPLVEAGNHDAQGGRFNHVVRQAAQYTTRERTGKSFKFLRPLRNFSSMRNTASRIFAPSFCTSAAAAAEVPPVASRSSISSTRAPGLSASV